MANARVRVRPERVERATAPGRSIRALLWRGARPLCPYYRSYATRQRLRKEDRFRSQRVLPPTLFVVRPLLPFRSWNWYILALHPMRRLILASVVILLL